MKPLIECIRYGIVIFSNQNGLNTDQRLKSFKTKIQDVLGQVWDIPNVCYRSLLNVFYCVVISEHMVHGFSGEGPIS